MSGLVTTGGRTLAAAAALAFALAAGPGYTTAPQAAGPEKGQDGRNGNNSVAARLGGFPGIFNFLDRFAVPAELADPEIAPFFANLTETPGDIETCLAMLLDHDLGGSSPHNGFIVPATGHQCRSSMSNIHRGRNIPDRIVDKFIAIVGEQAAFVGVADSDIAEVAKVLESYRGGVRNK
jgi:hypothetical protein